MTLNPSNKPTLSLGFELARPGYMPEHIALGVNTDAYQPCERELRLTGQMFDVLSKYRHPVALITKSSLIKRDIKYYLVHEYYPSKPSAH